MNPYFILALVVGWGLSVGGAFFYGEGVGKDHEIAGQAKISQAIQETKEAAQQGAADAIAQIRITNTTVQGKVQTIVRESTVYRDCINTDAGVRNINSALTGKQAEPAGSGKLPTADGTKRP